MTHPHVSSSEGSSSEGAANFPPGIAPSFGDVPLLPFEHTPERLVLSSEAHSHLVGHSPLASLGGAFSHDRFGTGNLLLSETGSAGDIDVHADLLNVPGPALHLQARVRESWLIRTVSLEDASPANVRVVNELFRLAEIPRQSTVTVRVEAS